MGRRGPAPTPKPVLEARGSWLADGMADAPEPRDGEPDQPPGLSDDAATHWPRVCKDLEELGTLRQSDGLSIGMLCEVHVQWRTAVDLCGALRRSKKAEVKERIAADRAAVLLYGVYRSSLAEFGLTPSSSARVQVAHKKPKKEGVWNYVGGQSKTA